MTKRYYIRYDDGKAVCGSTEHTYCHASTIKSAKTAANKCKSMIPNAHDIRVFDIEQEDENENALCVYEIA